MFPVVSPTLKIIRDPTRQTRLLPLYDSGDQLHPNDTGYEAMAEVIDLKLFRTRAT
jgi:lysophospholipase L1-like esterase